MIVYTANLQHGEGTDAVQDFQRQITALADADLMAIQERTTGETGWNTPMSNAGFAEVWYRENDPGQGDGPAIWRKTSTVTVHTIYEVDLSEGAIGGAWAGSPNVDKAAVGAKLTVNGSQFYFVSTHLAWSAAADSEGSTYSSIRVAQLETLRDWIAANMTGGLDILLAGDLNFGPDYPKNPVGLQFDILGHAGFVDLWTWGIANGVATTNWNDRDLAGGPDMPIGNLTSFTHDTRRIDFILLKKGNGVLTPTAIELPDNRANCSGALTGSPAFCPDTNSLQRWGNSGDFGVRPSDHNFVKATITVASKSAKVHGKGPAKFSIQ